MISDMKVIRFIEAGIRAEAARQKAIASNIANMNAPGYRRADVRFEEILSKALKTDETGEKIDPGKLEAQFYRPETNPVKANGNDVSLDQEVGEMVKNSLRHRTYMALLKKKYEQMKLALQV